MNETCLISDLLLASSVTQESTYLLKEPYLSYFDYVMYIKVYKKIPNKKLNKNMSNQFYDNKAGFVKNSLNIKPVRPAPKELENQIAKLHSFIKSANGLIDNYKKQDKGLMR